MANRQTRNISLPPYQDAFVESMVSAGRYRTASEVVRQGLRLLEEAEHRRLLEKWIYEGLDEAETQRVPPELLNRAKQHFGRLVDTALREVADDTVTDGPAAMARLRRLIEERS